MRLWPDEIVVGVAGAIPYGIALAALKPIAECPTDRLPARCRWIDGKEMNK